MKWSGVEITDMSLEEVGGECPLKEGRTGKEKGCLHLNTFTSISWKKEQGMEK